jgi:hypothetical protein
MIDVHQTGRRASETKMVSDWIRRIRNIGTKLLEFIIDDVGITNYFMTFFLVVIIWGFFYFVLTPCGHGLGQSGKFLQGLYFSAVTVSSLGYGDLQPLGFSKVLACLEVFFGLAFMGILIAKITSRRLSYHVQRLFSSDAQKRLDEFAIRFETLNKEILATTQALGKLYQTTPARANSTVRDEHKTLERFRRSTDALHENSAGLAEYLSYEVSQGGYFKIAPVDAIRRVASSVDQGLFNLGQLILSLSPEAKTKTLDQINRQRITNSIKFYYGICDMIDNNSSDNHAVNCSIHIRQTCKSVFEAYFSTPSLLPRTDQPDQKLQGANDPQS